MCLIHIIRELSNNCVVLKAAVPNLLLSMEKESSEQGNAKDINSLPPEMLECILSFYYDNVFKQIHNQIIPVMGGIRKRHRLYVHEFMTATLGKIIFKELALVSKRFAAVVNKVIELREKKAPVLVFSRYIQWMEVKRKKNKIIFMYHENDIRTFYRLFLNLRFKFEVCFPRESKTEEFVWAYTGRPCIL